MALMNFLTLYLQSILNHSLKSPGCNYYRHAVVFTLSSFVLIGLICLFNSGKACFFRQIRLCKGGASFANFRARSIPATFILIEKKRRCYVNNPQVLIKEEVRTSLISTDSWNLDN